MYTKIYSTLTKTFSTMFSGQREISQVSKSVVMLAGITTHTLCFAHIPQQDAELDIDLSSGGSCYSQEVTNKDFPGCFASIEEAVAEASNRFNPESIDEDREFMGAILKYNDVSDLGHAYTYTATAGDPGAGQVTIKLKLSNEFKVVAFWHTHGGVYWSRKYFSDVDTSVANHWGLPFFMADYSGKLRVFNPGDKTLSLRKARTLGLGRNRGYAKGSIVKDPDTGKPLKINTKLERVVASPKVNELIEDPA